jgi:hypothetical protein
MAGKNIAHAAVLAPLLAAIMLAACFLFRVPQMIGLGALWIVIETAAMMGTGVVVSVLLPNRLYVRGMGYQSPGCIYLLLQSLAGFVGLSVLIIPAAMIALSVWLASPLWSIVLLPLALVYAVAVYAVGLTIADSLIERHTPSIIARLSPSE